MNADKEEQETRKAGKNQILLGFPPWLPAGFMASGFDFFEGQAVWSVVSTSASMKWIERLFIEEQETRKAGKTFIKRFSFLASCRVHGFIIRFFRGAVSPERRVDLCVNVVD